MSICKYLNTSSPCPFGHDAVRGIEQGIDHQHLAAMTATMVMIIDSCCYIYHDDDAGDQTKYVDRILFGKIFTHKQFVNLYTLPL